MIARALFTLLDCIMSLYYVYVFMYDASEQPRKVWSMLFVIEPSLSIIEHLFYLNIAVLLNPCLFLFLSLGRDQLYQAISQLRLDQQLLRLSEQQSEQGLKHAAVFYKLYDIELSSQCTFCFRKHATSPITRTPPST